jgi:hypothetical protein
MWRFRDTRNKCYRLTIGEKDLVELAFAGLSTTLKDEMEGHDFIDINQVMQWAMVHENRAREHKAYSRFKEISAKDKPGVNCVDGSSDSEEEAKVCITEWLESPKDKPVACLFLRPSPGKRDEMKLTFYVNKCDRLFDVLLQNGVICLSEGHVVPPPGQMAKGKYCKWYVTFSHNTNSCNYFRRQVQSALNDGQLTLRDGNKMRLDNDPFPAGVNMINFKEKNVLVRTS